MALLRFEAGRLLRSRALWGAVLAVLALRTFYTWEYLPNLTMEPVTTAGTALLIAAVVLVSANLAVTRDRRGGLAETLGAVPGGADVRTWSVGVATTAVGAAVTGLVVGAHLLVRSFMGPVGGRFDPYEVLGAAAVTALAAVLGVALGRWLPWLITGPVAVFVLALVTMVNMVGEFGGWYWLGIFQHGPEWGDRPSGPHLIYLVAVTAAVGAAAMLKYGPRPARVVAAVAALAVAVPSGAAQADAPVLPWTVPKAERAAAANPLGARVCERRGAVTYCAYAGYTDWIPLWEKVMRPVVAAVPPAAAGRIPVVAQDTVTFDDLSARSPAAVRTWLVWPREGTAAPHRVYLAGTAAATIVGLRTDGTRDGWRTDPCDARGQARAVIALWLAGQSGPLLAPGSHLLWIGEGRTASISSQLGGFEVGAAERGYAQRLLDQPGARERVWAEWDTLVSPETTVAQALPLLGLRREFPQERPRGEVCR
jgi:hypothetical protein